MKTNKDIANKADAPGSRIWLAAFTAQAANLRKQYLHTHCQAALVSRAESAYANFSHTCFLLELYGFSSEADYASADVFKLLKNYSVFARKAQVAIAVSFLKKKVLLPSFDGANCEIFGVVR